MKSNKQLSEEILEKISKREIKRLRTKKIVRRVGAAAIMLGFLLPATVYFSINEDLHRYRPLAYPFENSEEEEDSQPFDPDIPSGEPQIHKSDDRLYVFTLT